MNGETRSDMNMEIQVSSVAPVRRLTTTLNEIRRHVLYDDDWKLEREALGITASHNDPWRNLLKRLGKTRPDDEPLPLEVILEVNGFDNALAALKEVRGYEIAKRLYLCNCARKVLPIYEKTYPGDVRPRQAIETAERFASGHASESERHAAEGTAWTAWKDAESAAGPSSMLSARWFIEGSTKKTAAMDAAASAAWAISKIPERRIAVSDAKNAVARAAVWRSWIAPLRTIAVVTQVPGSMVFGVIAGAAAVAGLTLEGNKLADLLLLGFAFAGTWFLAMEAIQALVGRSMKTTYESARAAAEKDLEREFIRLCRLEGEYGEVPE